VNDSTLSNAAPLAWLAVLAIAGVFSFHYNATHVASVEHAGHVRSTHLSGDNDDVSYGFTPSGQIGLVVTPSSLQTAAVTEVGTFVVAGRFNAAAGADLELRTMANGTKQICQSKTPTRCWPVLQ
jgi:hypothetical protein